MGGGERYRWLVPLKVSSANIKYYSLNPKAEGEREKLRTITEIRAKMRLVLFQWMALQAYARI